jgi:hypothetical protein
MAVARSILQRLFVGAAALIAITSFACALAAFRFGSAADAP